MSRSAPNLLTRNDTILGVCEAIGEDLGFNPNWLRVGLASFLLFYPWGVFATYLALGAVVLVSRLLFPKTPRTARAVAAAPAGILVEAGLEPIEVAAERVPLAA